MEVEGDEENDATVTKTQEVDDDEPDPTQAFGQTGLAQLENGVYKAPTVHAHRKVTTTTKKHVD